ncbi:hypothetical protein M8J76_000008 [Diaphorina citri]|nr:hypothetical protein M8J76_000008 [Diaphorina citri]
MDFPIHDTHSTLGDEKHPWRNYRLCGVLGQNDPCTYDLMKDDSILHKELKLPWQRGFFPDEQSFNECFGPLQIPGGSYYPDTPSVRKQLYKVQDMFITGTTTLGFRYPEGIILATDSRATANDLIVSQKLNKVIPVSSSILCTLAGNAADCVYWLHSLAKECKGYECKYRTGMTIRHAANLLVNMVRKYRTGNHSSKIPNGLSFGTLMAAYDEILGPQLYMLDNTGLLIEGTKFCVGSGAEYAQAILDTDYRPDLSEEEAYALATSAIYHACRRDIHSGGCVRLYKINGQGWQQVLSRDVKDIYNDRKEAPPGGGDH